jgi:hypothetical protein
MVPGRSCRSVAKQNAYHIHERRSSIIADRNDSGEAIHRTNISLGSSVIINEKQDSGNTGYSIIVYYLLRRVSCESQLPFKGLSMVVDHVGSGANDNYYCSAGWQKVDMHFCHAVVGAVWNVSYLSWQGSA